MSFESAIKVSPQSKGDSESLKRAKRFFSNEYINSMQTELDFFALWPPVSQDPPYFWNVSPPRNYSEIAKNDTLLWLVPLDNDNSLININGDPWPDFGSLSNARANARPNKTIRYLGRLSEAGKLIILGWMDITTSRYKINHNRFLTIDFRNKKGKEVEPNIYEGKWAYYPIPKEISIQTGTINYKSHQLNILLMS